MFRNSLQEYSLETMLLFGQELVKKWNPLCHTREIKSVMCVCLSVPNQNGNYTYDKARLNE